MSGGDACGAEGEPRGVETRAVSGSGKWRPPPCPECGGLMRWVEPPDARTTRWWCVAFPRCFGQREPESQKEMRL